ncbi:hypothetical protein LIA77_09737 [Sarocladium implicatum]|nr:hypothetical protein LIA77_09737 [Sarocladium implicatum]
MRLEVESLGDGNVGLLLSYCFHTANPINHRHRTALRTNDGEHGSYCNSFLRAGLADPPAFHIVSGGDGTQSVTRRLSTQIQKSLPRS